MSSGGGGGNQGARAGAAAGAGGIPVQPAGGAAGGGVPAGNAGGAAGGAFVNNQGGAVPNPNDMAAAMANAMGVVMRNMPGFNLASATTTLHMIQGMRKYDGSYSAELWLSDFDQERSQYGLDATWAIRNIDRILEGTASTWWKSQRAVYLRGLVAPNAVPNDVYRRLCDSMKTFFSDDSIKERARVENNHVKYNPSDDPVQYVARKVDVLVRMNPLMSPKEQVMHLLLGLPDDIRRLVSPGDVDTVDKFSYKLSQQLALHRWVASQSSGDSKNPNGAMSSSYRGVKVNKGGQKKSSPNKPIPGLNIPTYDDDHKAKCVDEDGNRTCFHCQKKGHTVRACFKLAREQNVPIPGQSGKKSAKKPSGN